jgi:chromosome partitioning protein
MPVIPVASPKGGSGKSTTALVLATTLVAKGATVSLIDTDPQRTITKWAHESTSKYRTIVRTILDPNSLVDAIDAEAESKQFVIVDVQGRATMTIARTMSRADFVIIPMQAKTPDADEASEAIALIRDEERVLRRTIPHMALLTRTNAGVMTKEEREIIAQLANAGIRRFTTALNERTAFSRLHSFKLGLDELNPSIVNGVSSAIENADKLAGELVTHLTEGL